MRIEDRRTRFTIVENDVLDTPDLSPSEKLVYIMLCRFAYHKNKCHPSTATIAKLAGISRRSVFNAISRLKNLGIIEVQSRNGGSNVYIIKGMQPLHTPYAKNAYPLCNHCIPPMQKMHHEEYISEEYISEENTNVRPCETAPEESSEIVRHLYEKFKTIGIKKSQNWFKRQLGIARNLLKSYSQQQIIEVINFAFNDEFWRAAFAGLEHFDKVLQKKIVLRKEGGDCHDGGGEDDSIIALLRERTKRYLQQGVSGLWRDAPAPEQRIQGD